MNLESALDTRMRPEFLQNVDCFVKFDAPVNQIDGHIQACIGWFAATRDIYPDFFVNGTKIENISFYSRADVKEYAKNSFNEAWTFYLDVARYMTPEQGTLQFDVVWDGQLIERQFYRVGPTVFPRADRELVAFIHVPKSGGTSLRRALEQHSDTYKILPSYEDHGFLRISDLQQISKSALDNYDAVFGHFQYGIHSNFFRKTRYISIIRNPYDLIVSYYFYAKNVLRRSEILACPDIYAAVRDRVDPFFDNITTRVFAGIQADAAVDDAVYSRALTNIENNFEFIGVLESPAASFSRIGAYLGLDLKPMFENFNARSKELDLIDLSQFRAFAEPYIAYDLALYEHVLRKFWGAGNLPRQTLAIPKDD